MQKQEILSKISDRIISLKKDKPYIVGINGIDGSGKSYFSRELYAYMNVQCLDVELISIDNFLNNKKIRYKKGSESPEGFYHDSYNYEEFIKYVIHPFLTGGGQYCKQIFNVDANKGVEKEFFEVQKISILLVEGIFLFRPELADYFDYRIFLDVSFETALSRNLSRDTDMMRIGRKEKIINRYELRYRPGQELYFEESSPEKYSDLVIDNNDYCSPLLKTIKK